MTKTAVVIGVGPLRGLGAVLSQSASAAGLHVVVAGRTQAKVDAVAEAITSSGGAATAIACDTTDEEQVIELMDKVPGEPAQSQKQKVTLDNDSKADG